MNEKIELRPAALGDGDLLARLNAPVQQTHVESEPCVFKADPDSGQVSAFFECLLAMPQNTVVLAFVGDTPAGYIWYEHQDRPESPLKHSISRIFVHQIATLPSCRGIGVGRTLMRSAIEYAKRHSIHIVDLDSWAFNMEAHGFFESLGFSTFNINMRLKL